MMRQAVMWASKYFLTEELPITWPEWTPKELHDFVEHNKSDTFICKRPDEINKVIWQIAEDLVNITERIHGTKNRF